MERLMNEPRFRRSATFDAVQVSGLSSAAILVKDSSRAVLYLRDDSPNSIKEAVKAEAAEYVKNRSQSDVTFGVVFPAENPSQVIEIPGDSIRDANLLGLEVRQLEET